MRPSMLSLPLLSILLLVAPLASVSAAVDWSSELVDVSGDVRSTSTGSIVEGHEGIDIVSVSITDQGNDINLSMVLAGAFEAEANYQVTAIADGDDGKMYDFTYSFSVFTVTGHDMVEDDPETYVSSDGTVVSWMLPKSQVTASSSLELKSAESMLLVGITNNFDTVPDESVGPGNGNGGGGDDNDDEKKVTPGFAGPLALIAVAAIVALVSMRRR
jgi:hypothetical protein